MIAWLLIPAVVLAAEAEGTVEGIVFQEGTGDPMASVEVRVGDRSTTTNADGRFELAMPDGTWAIVVVGPGGRTRSSVRIRVVPGRRSEALITWSTTRDSLPALVEEPEGASVIPESDPIDGPTGTLRGVIQSDEDGEPIAGARVYVRGQAIEAITDARGRFEMTLPTGPWELAVVASSFASQSVAELFITEDTLTEVTVALVPAGLALEDFYVRAPKVTGGTAALLDERRDSADVADVIGSEQMARAGDSSAASALRRVTGLTLVGGQFVYVRGLGERYSTTLLNGANLPSPDPERRVVPLDMFPASILSSVLVQKTFSPDMPGEFGGGAVVLRTRTIPTEPVFNLSLSGAWQEGATFTDGALAPGRGLDWLGMDGGLRGLPSELAATEPGSVEQGDRFGNGVPDDQLETLGESLNNAWYPQRLKLPPNVGASMTLGNGWSLGQDRKVGALLGLSWSNSFDQETYRKRYFVLGGGEQLGLSNTACAGKDDTRAVHSAPDNPEHSAAVRSDYCFNTTQRSVRLSGLLTLGVQPAKGHLIESTTVALRNTDDTAFTAEGYYVDIDGDLRLSEARWVERMLTSQMLRGTHALAQGDHAAELGWRYVYSIASRLEPDRRTTRYDLDANNDVWLLSNRPEGNQRFWSTSSDQTHDIASHVSIPIPVGTRQLTLKTGGQFLQKNRLVASRAFKFNTDALDIKTRQQLPEQVFTPDNIEPGLARLDEITRNTDSYEADQTLWAVYGMVRAPVTPWLDLMGGVRVEHSTQVVVTRELFGEGIVQAELSTTDPLPAFTATARPRKDMQVRAGYGRTVSRPEFRELSEAIFRDVLGGRQTLGNADLQRATIDSLDLRWEWFPEQGDVVSVSGFFKQFTNPIEPIVIPGAEFSTTFENAAGARNYGLELEFRKNMGVFSDVLADLYVAANVSLIQSRIQLDSGVQTNQQRALSGQSPWVVNAQVGYDNPDLGVHASLLYNAAGPRIVEVGAFGFPDTWETPRHNLDLIFSAQLPRGFELRLSGRNLIDSPTLVTVDDKAGGIRYTQERRFSGRQIGLRLGWRL